MSALTSIRRLALAASVLAAAWLAFAAPPALGRFHEYSGAFYGSGTDALQSPGAIAVDNSGGPSAGDVYVADTAAFRIEKFDPQGNFILMFGIDVDKTAVEAAGSEAERNLCSAASGDECQAGAPEGVFADPSYLAVDGSGGPSAGDVYLAEAFGPVVYKFAPSGLPVSTWGVGGQLSIPDEAFGMAVSPGGELEVLDGSSDVGRYSEAGTPLSPAGRIAYGGYSNLGLAIDGEGNFYVQEGGLRTLTRDDASGSKYAFVTADQNVDAFTVDQRTNAPYAVQGGATVQQLATPCDPPPVKLQGYSAPCPVAETFGAGRLAGASGIAIDSATGDAYVSDTGHDRIVIFRGIPPTAPTVSESVTDVHSESITLRAQIDSTGEDTSYRFEYGPTDCSAGPDPCTATAPTDIGAPQSLAVSAEVAGLAPATTYHYRVLATNALGTTAGPDRTFTTYPATPAGDACPNALARQQTGAGALLDCRAYELVSAAAAGGASVASGLAPGPVALPGYPAADGRALYTTESGGVPGTGSPTDHGGDPYLATRSESGWSTEYVGIPADINQQTGPFASTLAEATPGLGAFAFAGKELCDPCLGGETGLPVRTASGALVQGMAGSLDPGSAAEADILVRRRLSADGAHLIFGSSSRFEPDATPGLATIYDRDLDTDTTKVVSKLPGGGNIPCLTDCAGTDGVAELGLSADGSRVLIGQLVSTDAEGNRYWHLYMNIGDSARTIDLTPGATSGVLFDGMSADGSEVYFTSAEELTGDDTDHSADIYRAQVSASAAALTRVSTGSEGTGNTDACDPAADSARPHWNSVTDNADCDAVAIAGGGGVASTSADIYFLSPELLDGATAGTEDAPNLYLARPGSAPEYVSTLESALDGPSPLPTRHRFLHHLGAATDATGVAIDHSSGDIYVLDAGTDEIEKFDPEGNPVDFGCASCSAAGTDTLTGAETPAGSFSFFYDFFGSQTVTGLAVDPSTGDLYVPNVQAFGAAPIDVFSPSGEYLRQILGPKATAVAVDPTDGDLYAVSPGGLSVFDSSGNPLPAPSVLADPTSVAVDSSGTLYVGNGTEAASYETAGGRFLGQIDPHPALGLSVDPTDQHVYVDEGARFSEFDPEGNPVGVPSGEAELSGSAGIAADSGRVYAADGVDVAVFAPPTSAPGAAIDNPAVLDSLSASETPDSAAFEVSPSGADALFTSTRPLTGYENAGYSEVFRYDAPTGALACVSCDPANAAGTGDATLATDGSSLTADGRVFFTTPQRLVLRDVDSRRDVYEWEGGQVQLISTGTSPFDSELLSVSGDGTDAYFFTRDTLVPGDQNGAQVKLYDARAGGGFFIVPGRQPCAASDECHGAGSEAAPTPAVTTHSATPGNLPSARCKRGFARHRGKCSKKAHHHTRERHHQSKRHHHKRRAAHDRGGKK